MARVLAPILPFLTEEIYQNIVQRVDASAPPSVHLTDYPRADETRVDEVLERRIDAVIRTKNIALALRNQANVRARQPLGKVIVRPRDAHDREVLADPHFRDQVLEEINVKTLELIEDESGLVTREVKPNFPVLGPRYGKHMKAIAAKLAAADPVEVERAVLGDGFAFEVDGDPILLVRGDVEVRLRGAPHLAVLADAGTFAALDTTISAELEQEGMARDFNRQAQNQRKELDLRVGERIRVLYRGSPRVAAAIDAHAAWLAQELLADALGRVDGDLAGIEIKVGGEPVTLSIERA
jgi:isoleucyl-tRNA synthetase